MDWTGLTDGLHKPVPIPKMAVPDRFRFLEGPARFTVQGIPSRALRAVFKLEFC